jgi:hypothetical protein
LVVERHRSRIDVLDVDPLVDSRDTRIPPRDLRALRTRLGFPQVNTCRAAGGEVLGYFDKQEAVTATYVEDSLITAPRDRFEHAASGTLAKALAGNDPQADADCDADAAHGNQNHAENGRRQWRARRQDKSGKANQESQRNAYLERGRDA